MPGPKIVFFLSPELHDTITRVLTKSDWDIHIYLTGGDNAIDLTDLDDLILKLKEADICVISTHTDFSGEYRKLEIEQGMYLAEACKRSKIQHIIFFGHLSCERAIGIPARHYDSKSEIYHYMRQDLELPVTLVNVPPLYEIFYDFLCPILANSICQIAFPSVGQAPIDFIAKDDIGPCILPILTKPGAYINKTVALCGDKLTGKMVTTILREELPDLQFVQKEVTVQDVRERRYQGAVDIANMFEFLSRGDLKTSPTTTKELYPQTKTFRQWVQQNHNQLKQEILGRPTSTSTVATVI